MKHMFKKSKKITSKIDLIKNISRGSEIAQKIC